MADIDVPVHAGADFEEGEGLALRGFWALAVLRVAGEGVEELPGWYGVWGGQCAADECIACVCGLNDVSLAHEGLESGVGKERHCPWEVLEMGFCLVQGIFEDTTAGC